MPIAVPLHLSKTELATLQKAKKEIGFEAKVTLEDGLRELIAWRDMDKESSINGFYAMPENVRIDE